MYEAVNLGTDEAATASRFVRAASDYGFAGVVLRRAVGDAIDDPAPKPNHGALAAEAGIDVVECVEIVADEPSEAAGAVGGHRPDTTLVAVRGGTPALNRFAVEQERVDVLTRPLAGEGGFNHVLAKAAVENGVRVEFDLGPVLRTAGGERVRGLSDRRRLREILDHYDTPFVVSATPEHVFGLRAPRELRALGEVIGFGGERIESGLREWGLLAERNRERLDDAFIAPGVRRGRDEGREGASDSSTNEDGGDST